MFTCSFCGMEFSDTSMPHAPGECAQKQVAKLREEMMDRMNRIAARLGVVQIDVHNALKPQEVVVPPSKDVEALNKRVRFYELVLDQCPPHTFRGREKCPHAPEGEACCNPKCRGDWGTGCYCCHHGQYATDVTDEDLDLFIEAIEQEKAKSG